MNAILKTRIQEKLSNFIFNSGLNLNALSEEEKNAFYATGKKIQLAKKNQLYAEGEPPKGIFILLRGKIKVWRLNPDGSIQIIFIYTEGEIFGHRPILGDTRQPVSASALEDCELLFVEKEDFQNYFSNSKRLHELVMKSLGVEFSVMVNRINIFAQRGIKERLALFLLLLNETYKAPDQLAEQAEIRLNRNDLAGFTGTSVENLVRTLKTFKESGFIRTNGKSIYIDDFEGLYLMTGV